MIIAQTFFDEFHPGETVPPLRYAAEAVAVMAEQGMVRLLPDPAPEPGRKAKQTRAAQPEEATNAD